MQGSPLVHSASSILRCSVYSAAKSFPTAAVQHRINVMSNADKLLLNRSAPASKGPPQDQLPLCLDRSTNGALRRGPQGPLTTKQAPRESSPPSLPPVISKSFNHFSIRMVVLTYTSLIRTAYLSFCKTVCSHSNVESMYFNCWEEKSSMTVSGSEKEGGGKNPSLSHSLSPLNVSGIPRYMTPD